jgi:hypothetical protein
MIIETKMIAETKNSRRASARVRVPRQRARASKRWHASCLGTQQRGFGRGGARSCSGGTLDDDGGTLGARRRAAAVTRRHWAMSSVLRGRGGTARTARARARKAWVRRGRHGRGENGAVVGTARRGGSVTRRVRAAED